MRTFLELEESDYKNALILIDVDGTVVSDRGDLLSPEAREKLRSFASCSEVFLCSNALPERTRSFADECGIQCVTTEHRKPSRQVAEDIDIGDRNLIVIGDKALTDGLFASNIGAEFVMVRRLRGSGESMLARFAYALDAAAHPFLRLFKPLLPYVLLMRPTQWVKNGLVIAPVFFAGTVLSIGTLGQAALAAVVFSLAASTMYVLNDLKDVAQDRLHPTKRFRPLATGKASVQGAYVLAGILIALAAFGCLSIPGVVPVVLVYIAVNIVYSLWSKHVPVLDILSVSSSYVLRVLAGGAATATFVSPWIMSCVFFGALILITGKRRAELSRASRRRVLEMYSLRALDLLLAASAALAVLSYGLYSVYGGHGSLMVYSTILVAAAIFRLLGRIYKGKDAEYPETLALKDPWILGITALWVAFMFYVLYL